MLRPSRRRRVAKLATWPFGHWPSTTSERPKSAVSRPSKDGTNPAIVVSALAPTRDENSARLSGGAEGSPCAATGRNEHVGQVDRQGSHPGERPAAGATEAFGPAHGRPGRAGAKRREGPKGVHGDQALRFSGAFGLNEDESGGSPATHWCSADGEVRCGSRQHAVRLPPLPLHRPWSLKAALARHQISTAVLYLTFPFAEAIGTELYIRIANGE